MFDAADELLPWLDANRRVYQLLRLLYFASQGLLLAVAWLVEARLVGRATCDGRRGDCGGAHRHGRACRALRRRPVIASAYVDASATGSVESQRTLLVLHDVFADVGKFLRLGPGARGLARVPPRHRVPRPRRRSARRLRTSRRRRAATSDGSGAPVSGGSHALAVTSATTLRAAGLRRRRSARARRRDKPARDRRHRVAIPRRASAQPPGHPRLATARRALG
jgi:hypothetical protein